MTELYGLGEKLIMPARTNKYGKQIGGQLDHEKFAQQFGLDSRCSSDNPGHRAFQVIADVIDGNLQWVGMGEPVKMLISDEASSELISCVGREKALEIANTFCLTLAESN